MKIVNVEKKLVDKLVNECTENIDEVKLAKITLAQHENKYENMCKCSCTLYIALFSVLLTINIGISTFFVYYEYMMIRNICWRRFYLSNKNLLNMGNTKQINIKNQTYYFFNDMINVKNFDSNLLKIDKES